jgi:hypothetical protein
MCPAFGMVFVLKAAISIHPPSLRRDLKWNIEDMYEENTETEREVSTHISSHKDRVFHCLLLHIKDFTNAATSIAPVRNEALNLNNEDTIMS